MFFAQIQTQRLQQQREARVAALDESDVYEGGIDTEKVEIEKDSASKLKEGKASGKDQKPHEANIMQLCIFTFVIGLGNIQTGFAISGNNQTAPVIKAKFGWTESEAVLYNTLISSAAIFGIVTGSLVGGKFIQKGRRRALIIFNILGAVATTLTMFMNLPLIIIGRYFFGFCCGCFSVAGPKMLDETVPIHLSSTFGTATNTFLSGGIMVALLLGVGLPDDDDLEGQKETGFWRVIYGFQYLCQAVTILMFLTCWPEDSITYSISTGNDEHALSLIKKVYASSEDPDQILRELKGQSQKGSSGVTLSQACCEKRYLRSTWIAFALCFFQQQTGLDGIMIYSNTIFAQMAKKGAISITAKQGSYIVGCVNWIGAIVSPIPLAYFGRKQLLFWGQISMGISLCVVAVFQMNDMSIPLIIALCVFITSFQFSQGPIAWMYAAEVAVDTALGLCVLALFLSLLEKAITMEFMVHSAMGPEGMFFLLGGITLLGAVFVAIYIKETKGLSDKEKKSLYTPQDMLDEDAKEAAIEMGSIVKVAPEDDLASPSKLKDNKDMELVTPANIRENMTMASTQTKPKESQETPAIQAE